jgi:hypothetical protein
MSKNIQYDKFDYFCYIGAIPDKDYEPVSLILDTQVVIMLEKFYYNPHKLQSEVKAAVTEFLLLNIHKDRIPGFAMQEACWDRSLGSINAPQFARLQLAIDSIDTWDKERIIKHSQSNGLPYKDYVMREKVLFTKTMIPHLESNPLLLGSYATILKIHLMHYRKSKADKFKLIREFVDFMNEKVGIFHAVEFSLTIDYFLGNSPQSDNVQKLLKFGSKDPLGAIITSCWDLFFLRFLQLSFMEKTEGIIMPKLVSRDDALINIAKYASIHGLIEMNETPMPIVSFDHNDLDAYTVEFIEEVNRKIKNTAHIRSMSYLGDINKVVSKITETAKELEEELIAIIKRK